MVGRDAVLGPDARTRQRGAARRVEPAARPRPRRPGGGRRDVRALGRDRAPVRRRLVARRCVRLALRARVDAGLETVYVVGARARVPTERGVVRLPGDARSGARARARVHGAVARPPRVGGRGRRACSRVAARRRARPRSGAPRDTLALLLTGTLAATIAAYTLVDRAGIQRAGALTYFVLTLALPCLIYPPLVGARAIRRELGWAVGAAGLANLGSFTLGLLALRHGSAAAVLAVPLLVGRDRDRARGPPARRARLAHAARRLGARLRRHRVARGAASRSRRRRGSAWRAGARAAPPGSPTTLRKSPSIRSTSDAPSSLDRVRAGASLPLAGRDVDRQVARGQRTERHERRLGVAAPPTRGVRRQRPETTSCVSPASASSIASASVSFAGLPSSSPSKDDLGVDAEHRPVAAARPSAPCRRRARAASSPAPRRSRARRPRTGCAAGGGSPAAAATSTRARAAVQAMRSFPLQAAAKPPPPLSGRLRQADAARRFRATQISSLGHLRAQSAVTYA